MLTDLPIILLLVVFIFIALRKISNIHLPIWLIMLFAAIMVLLTGNIKPLAAYHAIRFEVMFYLFGVFIIGQALESSHYLEHISFRLFKNATQLKHLLFFVIIIFGLSSALLMNDTVAIIGTPIILMLAKQHKFPPKPFLLALAYAITLGSVMSPIGNPQNLLIANHGFANPFPIFLARLSIPTFINLILLYAMVLLCYRNDLNKKIQHTKPLKVLDKPLALLCKIALLIMLLLIAARITLSIFHINYRINFSAIALISAAPILLFSKKRFGILRKLDWHTLVFFIALFVFIEAVWLTEFFQHFIKSLHLTLSAKPTIISISVLLSQLISNVPLVALYLPLLAHATHAQLLALAVGSTVAGNLLILGAASNVIVIQNAEKRGVQAFSFWEFFKLGLPLTLINILVYYWFI